MNMKQCEYCGIDFSTFYEFCQTNRTETRFCSIECSNKSRCTYSSKEELITMISDYIISENKYCTKAKVQKEVKVSSKTLTKYQIKIKEINKNLGFVKETSIFQTDIYTQLCNITSDVVSEYTNDNLLSPKGFKLRIDFYLPKLGIFVEADGTQHWDTTSPWYSEYNVQCDNLKDAFAIKENIPLIRIPYKHIITKEYVLLYIQNYLNDNPVLNQD